MAAVDKFADALDAISQTKNKSWVLVTVKADVPFDEETKGLILDPDSSADLTASFDEKFKKYIGQVFELANEDNVYSLFVKNDNKELLTETFNEAQGRLQQESNSKSLYISLTRLTQGETGEEWNKRSLNCIKNLEASGAKNGVFVAWGESDVVAVVNNSSNVDSDYECGNPLIVMIGIGTYDNNMVNLPGVSIDYQMIKNTFNKQLKYNVLYASDHHKYKTKWSVKEINKFIDSIIENINNNNNGNNSKYDGLLFFISCHGNSSNEEEDNTILLLLLLLLSLSVLISFIKYSNSESDTFVDSCAAVLVAIDVS